MIFPPEAKLYATEVVREAGEDVLYVNYLGAPFVPSLADSPTVMAKTVDALIEAPTISRVVFVQQRNYCYDFKQISLLVEIGQLYVHLIKKEKVLETRTLASPRCRKYLPQRYDTMRYLVLTLLKQDPISCYVEAKRLLREERIAARKLSEAERRLCEVPYLRLLEKIVKLLEGTVLIKTVKDKLRTYKVGSRELYAELFRPEVLPNFTFTRLTALYPPESEIVDQYKIGPPHDLSTVTILKVPGKIKYMYHLMAPEFELSEELQTLINLARNVLLEHKPKAEEFVDPARIRSVFFNIARGLVRELSETKKIKLSYDQINSLATILVRHTIGFGLVEVLLQDEKLQDIMINAPIGIVSLFVRHQDFDECDTNIIPSHEDAESWAAKFRMISGRPLDEANPVLDTELIVGTARARVAIIQQPLSPYGLAYAIRRHREKPWTLPLYIDNRMINSLAAGVLSFLIDGSRTMLIAGTRSSGKCVDGDTLIQLNDGNLAKARELVENRLQSNYLECDDGYYSFVDDLEILTLNDKMKIVPQKVKCVWKRKAPKQLIQLKTASGKEIVTTTEHPYFTLKKGRVIAQEAEKLKVNKLIATPRVLEIGNTNKSKLNLNLEIENTHAQLPNVEGLIESKFGNAKSASINLNYSEGAIKKSMTEDFIPPQVARTFGIEKFGNLFGKTISAKIRFPEQLSSDFAEFLGYLIGDGHLDKRGAFFFNTDHELRERFLELGKRLFNIKGKIEYPKERIVRACLHSRVLARILNKTFRIPCGNKAAKVEVLGEILKGNKEVQISFTRSYFDCDATVNKWGEIELATASKKMAQQIQLLLLRFGVIAFLKKRLIKDKPYYRLLIRGNFSSKFHEGIGFGLKKKALRLEKALKKRKLITTNIDTLPGCGPLLKEIRTNLRIRPKELREATGKDYWVYENEDYWPSAYWFKKIVNFYSKKFEERKGLFSEIERMQKTKSLDLAKKLIQALNIKNEELAKLTGLNKQTISNFKNSRYKAKESTITKIIESIERVWRATLSSEEIIRRAYLLANSDIFWDKIVSIKRIKPKEEWVYDLTVEPTHNFIANGIIAHNTSMLGACMLDVMPRYRMIVCEGTLELPVTALRDLGYDVLRMKVREALTRETTELSAAEGIRTSLRLGDSALIVGEVRSEEALAMYEAMRVGALANVVAGTIHGSSPYSVFDRVVNDLKVPATSFKATDIITIVNPIKSPDGLHRWRRMLELTEVRKHWLTDPSVEHGFVTLLRYDVRKDELLPTDDLINGESEILKDIAGGVKGWAGSWDAVWDNIKLRARIKQTQVDTAKKAGMPELLEAAWTVKCNNAFHNISDKVREEIGIPRGREVFKEWQAWLKAELKKK